MTRLRAARRAARAAAAGFLLAGCAGGPATADTYRDPFAYCAAAGTVDAPDARYTGPAVPPVVADGLRRAFNAPADAPIEVFTRGTSWRCMDGRVYACTVGANLPCQARADTSRTPRPAVVEFCRNNPTSDVVPLAVTGRETVYQWRCQPSGPDIVRQLDTPDARGFLSSIWFRITPAR